MRIDFYCWLITIIIYLWRFIQWIYHFRGNSRETQQTRQLFHHPTIPRQHSYHAIQLQRCEFPRLGEYKCANNRHQVFPICCWGHGSCSREGFFGAKGFYNLASLCNWNLCVVLPKSFIKGAFQISILFSTSLFLAIFWPKLGMEV